MTHVMIDLETLDTEPSTVVLSVGLVEFSPETGDVDKIGGRLWFPKLGDQLAAGRTVSESTLLWWLKQGDEARKEIYGAKRQASAEVLDEIRAQLNWYPQPTYVWGNGSIFDIAILEHWMEYTRIPWKYYNVRDTRTLWHVHPYNKEAKGETAHTALDDAIAQAERVCEVWPR
jgi:hypothetical protein|tara:strand:- start:88 stop:606 length:519 start_codon:yes stop_codon:yes gene_type:complete